MSEENRGDPSVNAKDKDKDKTRKSKSSGKKMESDHINSDKTDRVKVTPSRQGAHSNLDAPTNQSMLDILGISPSHIKILVLIPKVKFEC